VGWTFEELWFHSPVLTLDFLSFRASTRTPALGPTKRSFQWIPVVFPLDVKRPGRAAAHSHLFCTGVTNEWTYTSTPLCDIMVRCLTKYRDNYILYSLLETEPTANAASAGIFMFVISVLQKAVDKGGVVLCVSG
jgi:hypothetical protein